MYTSGLQLILVVLGELSEEVPLLLRGQPHSTVRDLHAQAADGILAELYIIRNETITGHLPDSVSLPACLCLTYLVSHSRESNRVEQLAGNADANFTISWSKLHLQVEQDRQVSGQVYSR